MSAPSERLAAPEMMVERWFNTPQPISLDRLRGRPVLLHTFQMLCPGCVAHAIPQVQRIARMLRDTELAVIGLHTVFEHHAAMTPVSLEAFLHEYRITYPVGVDASGGHGPVPKTMAAYGLQGTPSTVLIDRQGLIRYSGFGQEDDIAIGLRIGLLLADDPRGGADDRARADDGTACDDEGCRP